MVLDKELIEQSFKAISGVRAVRFNTVFTVIVEVEQDSTEEMRFAIYDAEWELMRRFPEYLFDWHVIEENNDYQSVYTLHE